jgi:hypothetical protein
MGYVPPGADRVKTSDNLQTLAMQTPVRSTGFVPPGSTPIIASTDIQPSLDSENISELQGTGDFMNDMLYGLARTMLFDEDAVKIAQRLNPGSEIVHDEENDAWALKLPSGELHYINAPGPSKTDALQGAGLMATGGVTGLIAKQLLKRLAPAAFSKLAPMAGKARTAAGIGVADAITRDQIGNTIAGEGQIDFTRALTEGLGAAVGQKVFNAVTPLMAKGVNNVLGLFAGDKLSARSRSALEAAGINTDVLTPAEIRQINKTVRKYALWTKEQQGRAAFMESQGVRPTTANITRSPEDIGSQNSMLTGGMGNNMQGQAQSVIAKEQGDRVAQLADDLAPPGDVSVTQAALINRSETGYQALDAAIKDARARGLKTFAPEDIFHVTRQHVRSKVEAVSSRADADEILSDMPDIPEGLNRMDLNELFAWRMRVAKRGAPGQEAAHALDEVLKDAAEQQLLHGDASVATDWVKLMDKYGAHKTLWNANDLISKLVRYDKQGGKLLVAPEEAATFLLGVGDKNWTTKRGLATAIGKIRSTLGADSPEFGEMRNAIARRIIGGGSIIDDTAGSIPVKRFSGKQMREAFTKAMKERPDTMRMLFKPEEIQQFDNFTKMVSWLSTSAGAHPSKFDAFLKTLHAGTVRALDRHAPPGTRQMVPFLTATMGGVEAAAKGYTQSAQGARALNPLAYGPQAEIPLLGPAVSRGTDIDSLKDLTTEGSASMTNFFIDLLNSISTENQE